MSFIDTLHILIILAVKVKVVAFGFAHFQVLFFFFFWGICFSKSFDLSFRTFLPSFWLLLFFHFFQNMGKQLAESKVCTYLQDYQSQFKIMNPIFIGH